MGNLGFRTNNIYKQEDLQTKIVTPGAYGGRILPDAGYTAMPYVDLNDVPKETVGSTHVLGNAYGDTILIGIKEFIPVIENGVIVNPEYIDSYDEDLYTFTYNGLNYFGKTKYYETSGSVSISMNILLKNGYGTAWVSSKLLYSTYQTGQYSIYGGAWYYKDSAQSTSVTFSQNEPYECLDNKSITGKIRISSALSYGYRQTVRAGINNLYLIKADNK